MPIVHLMLKLDNDRIMVQRKKVFRRPIEHVISWGAVAAWEMHVWQRRADKYFICAIDIFTRKKIVRKCTYWTSRNKRNCRGKNQGTWPLLHIIYASSLFKQCRRQRQINGTQHIVHVCRLAREYAFLGIRNNWFCESYANVLGCSGTTYWLQAIGCTLWHSLFVFFFRPLLNTAKGMRRGQAREL